MEAPENQNQRFQCYKFVSECCTIWGAAYLGNFPKSSPIPSRIPYGRFPRTGLPPINHPFLDGISHEINPPAFWGYPRPCSRPFLSKVPLEELLCGAVRHIRVNLEEAQKAGHVLLQEIWAGTLGVPGKNSQFPVEKWKNSPCFSWGNELEMCRVQEFLDDECVEQCHENQPWLGMVYG